MGRGEVLDLSLYTIIGGVIGARIGYVLINLGDFAGDPVRILTIWKDAGLTYYGALAGGAIVAWLYGRLRGWNLGVIADAAAPSLALGYAIAMIGTLLYGLNYGRPTPLPWAITLFGQPRHPTQLYLMVASLLIFAVLMSGAGTARAPGRLFWEYLMLYGLVRAVIETFMDSPRVLGPLTLAQVASIIVAVISFVMWRVCGRAAPAGAASGPGGGPEAVDPRD